MSGCGTKILSYSKQPIIKEHRRITQSVMQPPLVTESRIAVVVMPIAYFFCCIIHASLKKNDLEQ